MKKIFLCGLMLPFAMAAIQSCSSENKNAADADTMMTDSTMTMSPADTTMNADTAAAAAGKDPASFVEKAAAGGMMEIECAKIALSNASDSKVKDFAQLMIKDHTKASEELATIAKSKKITVPAALPAMEQAHIDAMKNMKGAEFDKHYMDMMLNDHKKTVDLFKAAKTNADAELSAFAAKTLKVIELHTQMASDISGQLK